MGDVAVLLAAAPEEDVAFRPGSNGADSMAGRTSCSARVAARRSPLQTWRMPPFFMGRHSCLCGPAVEATGALESVEARSASSRATSHAHGELVHLSHAQRADRQGRLRDEGLGRITHAGHVPGVRAGRFTPDPNGADRGSGEHRRRPWGRWSSGCSCSAGGLRCVSPP